MTLLHQINQAIVLYQAGDLRGCRDACSSILAAQPDQAETRHLLGAAELALGQLQEAEVQVTLALVLHPPFSQALLTLGRIRLRRNRAAQAATALRWAQRMQPDDPALAAALAEALYLGRLAGADAACAQALRLDPACGAAWRTLGHLRRDASDCAAADAYARSRHIRPDRSELLSDEFFARLQCCDWPGARAAGDAIRQRAGADDGSDGLVTPLVSLLLDLQPADQDRLARAFFDRVIAAGAPEAPPVAQAARKSGPPLVVGYLSADFHDHATANLIAEIFELHDRRRFTVVGFSDGPDDGSPMRRRLARGFDRFHDVRPLDAGGIAALMAAEGVDILVDLKGITRGARLDLLAQRLAPLQVTWLGYPGTTGSPFIDYVIGDRIVTPPSHQPWFRERLAILPDCYQPNDRRRPRGDAPVTRATSGLPAKGIIFAALHAPHKITPAVFAVWMRILAGVPDSVLWLYDPAGAAGANLRREAAAADIDPGRLVFASPAPLAEHLARYRLADLCLDSLPYTGHTTTSDALWVGAPVVTCTGPSFAGRVATSLLHAAGLPDLATPSLEAYEALALALARDPARLAACRLRLAEGRERAALFDAPRFTAYLERAFRMMWERHVAGLPPEGFTVPRLPAPP